MNKMNPKGLDSIAHIMTEFPHIIRSPMDIDDAAKWDDFLEKETDFVFNIDYCFWNAELNDEGGIPGYDVWYLGFSNDKIAFMTALTVNTDDLSS